MIPITKLCCILMLTTLGCPQEPATDDGGSDPQDAGTADAGSMEDSGAVDSGDSDAGDEDAGSEVERGTEGNPCLPNDVCVDELICISQVCIENIIPEPPPAGSELGSCLPNDECDEGLRCLSEICVQDNRPEPGTELGECVTVECQDGLVCLSGICVEGGNTGGGNAPASWTCNDAWYGDNTCDCGCGVQDADGDCPEGAVASDCEYCDFCPGADMFGCVTVVDPENIALCIEAVVEPEITSPPWCPENGGDPSDFEVWEPEGGYPAFCDSLPAPVEALEVIGPIATEDLAFDNLGNLVGADDDGNLWRSTRAGPEDAPFSPAIPGTDGFTSGLRILPDGDVVYAHSATSSIYRVNPAGARSVVASGLAYPNGIAVDLEGNVWVAEQDASQVRKVYTESGESEIVATGLYNANGIVFSPNYARVYVGSFGGGTITAIDVNDDGTFGEPVRIRGGIGEGALDGMAVDECGNIYITEFGPGQIWRVSADGCSAEVVIEPDSFWVPNLQWGSGVGEWPESTLFVGDIEEGILWESPNIGVGSAPRPFP